MTKHTSPTGHHTKKTSKPYENITYWKALTVIFTVLFIISVATQGFRVFPEYSFPKSSTPSTSSETVKLDFYVMSQCPYGTEVEDAIAPVMEKLGDNLDLNLYFIANDNGNGQFSSLHGQPEVLGNIVQLCAIKHNPDKYMDMILCQNKNARSIPGNWEECSNQNNLNTEKIKECYEGDEGKALLSESIIQTNKVSATGSPTIYLNDERYSGGRTTIDFMRSVCNEFEKAPSACENMPKPKEVTLTILNDERCEECDVVGVISSLKGLFPGLKTTILDYSSSEGKQLYNTLNIQYLPALLFDDSVKEGEGYSNLQRYLQPTGDYLTLMMGSEFDPTAEICDNNIDDNNNNKIDCDDPYCQSQLVCRSELSQKLDLFVMSQCPYGVKAESALQEFLANFEGVDFTLHFIANDNGDNTFSSLHGQPEVDGNMRQACIEKYYPNKFLDYVYCQIDNYKNLDSTWESCASQNGISTEAINTCMQGDEGVQLLKEKIALANELNVGASPTWLANNRYQFSGIDAETVKQNFCKYNTDLSGCENTLSSDTGGVAPGSC